jgi:rhamnulokinase
VRVAAVDLGATSVRVAVVDLTAARIEPRVVHRRPHGPVDHPDGSLRWDWDGIVGAVREGLDAALAEGPLASIGVDGWAVDYGLLAADGRLLSPPFSYRDGRTSDWQAVAERIGPERLYATTGIQMLAFNSIFQLAVHDPEELAAADRLLLLPDLLVHQLVGYDGAERSNASTTALMDAATGDWSPELLDAVGVPARLLPPIRDAGERVGSYRGVPVHLVGSHDTASAVIGLPGVPGPGTAFVSSGTWVLVGAERPRPDTSLEAHRANFSNELGAMGGVRFLKNVMGFWMLERCRDAWGSPPVGELVDAATEVDESVPLVDAMDERFLAPDDMVDEVRAAAGLGPDASVAVIIRCILESIAAATARVLDELGGFTGHTVDELFVVGGGVRMGLLNELLGVAAGARVVPGSPEAAALGNAMVQGIALGRFADVPAARRAVGAARHDPA